VRLEAVGLTVAAFLAPEAKGERPRRVYTITAKGRRAAIPDI
jgi:DNA-binding PadR family transcriptional regulator